MTIRLRHIEALQAVQKAGSITGAAELLNVSQPAVSKLLRHAEDQLGLRLFERVKGKLVPTREAKLLEVEIDRTFAGLERISSIAANLRRGREGHVRIACLPSLGFGFMTEQMASFHRRHPGVSFDLRTHHTREILDLVATNDLDLAIAYEPALPPGMRKIAIGTSRLVHLSTAPLAKGEAAEITLDRIDVETLIGVDPDTSIGATLSDAFDRAGIRYAPRNEAELRSANYAPRSGAEGYRPPNNGGYRPTHYQPQNYYREQGYRPEGASVRPAYQPEARPAEYAHPAYRPQGRPVQYAHPAPRSNGGGGYEHHHN